MPVLSDKLAPQERDIVAWDDKLSGFGVKVTPKGRKVYLLYYAACARLSQKTELNIFIF
mgnify:CR=1 FL=1